MVTPPHDRYDSPGLSPIGGGEDTAPCTPASAEANAGRIRARDALVVANVGLVHHHARGLVGGGVDRGDLVQIGAVGLMRAAELYDPARGPSAPYATRWIRVSMGRALDAARGGGSPCVEERGDVADTRAVGALEAL